MEFNKNVKNKHWHRKTIKIPVYKTSVILTLTNNVDNINKIHGIDEDIIYGLYVHDNMNKNTCHYIYLNMWYEEYKATEGVIAHECLHAVMEICREKGIVLDYDNQEPVTYLTEYLVDKTHEFIDSICRK